MLQSPTEEEEVETGAFFQSLVSDPSSLASSGCVVLPSTESLLSRVRVRLFAIE